MVGVRVALVVIAGASCRPRAEPAAPVRVPQPAPPRVHETPPRPAASGPRYLVGEVCINAVLRGPHFFPRFAGGDIGWTADESVARVPLTEAPQYFNVLGFDGERHGFMVTATDGVRTDPRGFVGDYHGEMGVGPCTYVRPDGGRVIRVDCGNAGGCGLAVAIAARTSPPAGAAPPPARTSPPAAPPTAEGEVTTLCVAAGALIGDLDRDGANESFPIDGFRDQGAVDGVPYEGEPCPGRFASYRIALGADVLDVLGAADLDQDGQLELLIAFTPAGGQRSVALYVPAPAPALRLDRRAVAPW